MRTGVTCAVAGLLLGVFLTRLASPTPVMAVAAQDPQSVQQLQEMYEWYQRVRPLLESLATNQQANGQQPQDLYNWYQSVRPMLEPLVANQVNLLAVVNGVIINDARLACLEKGQVLANGQCTTP